MSDRDTIYPSGYCPSCLKGKDKCKCVEESIENSLKEVEEIDWGEKLRRVKYVDKYFEEREKRNKKDK